METQSTLKRNRVGTSIENLYDTITIERERADLIEQTREREHNIDCADQIRSIFYGFC